MAGILRRVAALVDLQRRGDQPPRVADRRADPPRPEVEPEQTAHRSAFRWTLRRRIRGTSRSPTLSSPSTSDLSLSSWSLRATRVAPPDWTMTRSSTPRVAIRPPSSETMIEPRGLDGEDVALDGVALGVGRDERGQGPPVADVVPVVDDFQDADVAAPSPSRPCRSAPSPSAGYSRAIVSASSGVPERLADAVERRGELGPVASPGRRGSPGPARRRCPSSRRTGPRPGTARRSRGRASRGTGRPGAARSPRRVAERLAALDVAVAGLGPGRLDAEGDEGRRVVVDDRDRRADGLAELLAGLDHVVGRHDDHRPVGVGLRDDRAPPGRRTPPCRAGRARPRRSPRAARATGRGPPRPGRPR